MKYGDRCPKCGGRMVQDINTPERIHWTCESCKYLVVENK